MNYLYIVCFIILGSCTAAKSPIDMISEASFGTKESRIQFHENGEEVKVSYEVGSYDNISGATYMLESEKDGMLTYKNGESTLVVKVVDEDTVGAVESVENTPMIFTPKAKNLGKRP